MKENRVLEKTYDPRSVEPEVYAQWERCGAFCSKPDGSPHDRTFTMVIPPPNVTGALHLGHALNNTLQDILIRYHRMRGFNTLWQPGTDHAGIATQAVVERRIKEKEGKTRHDLGRDELVKRIWQWKEGYEKRIIRQLKLMGCSCDWSRIRFTLDEGLARAVREMFFKLFKDGLIFRGKRLVNWDTELQTAVSDDEVYYETVKGHFWSIKYPVNDPQPGEPDHVMIATTRPETMLGDTAVAVHPDPERFFDKREAELRDQQARLARRSGEGTFSKEAAEVKAKLERLRSRRESHLEKLIQLGDMARDGRKLLLPLVEREIPLITDEWADPMKGSGCVKITPAHDPNDWEVGLRHELPMVNVLTQDGKIARIIEPDGSTNPRSTEYEGLAFAGEGRAKVVADLEARGLLHDVEDHDIELGHSDRSKRPIEPYLSDQWFVQTGDISDPQRAEPRALARANSEVPAEPRASARANSEVPAEPRASARANAPMSTPPPTASRLRPRSADLSLGATLLTWTTYGTWLPGDDRGSVSRAPRADGGQSLRNLPGEPYDRDDPQRKAGAKEKMAGRPIRLSPQFAPILLECIADTCERHGIELLAVAIMPDHVHVLCQGQQHGADMLQLIKGNAARRLSQDFVLGGLPRWWTKSGSRRRIKAGADLTGAVDYVKNQEHPLLVWSFDVHGTQAARIVEDVRACARSEIGGPGSTVERGDVAQAEACGSGGLPLPDGSRVPGLAQAAMDTVEDGRIQVLPPRYAKSYLDWLGEKRDWCISRQLWWGHRIPVWKWEGGIDDASWKEFIASVELFEDPNVCVRCYNLVTLKEIPWRIPMGTLVAADKYQVLVCLLQDSASHIERLKELRFTRDEDVLDTWFSSALWPFSTLGWPEETEHLKQYYPGSVLCTSRDIITNWVARMVMFGLYATGKIPFDHVYIHPKILDGRGETMSKSKGNGVDPVDIIHTHGADALRYTMADMTTETQDIRMPVEYVCPHCGQLTDQVAALRAEQQARKSRGHKLDRKLQPADCTRVRCLHKDCGREFATQWADDALRKELSLGRETSDKFDIGRNFCNKLWNAARFAFLNLDRTPCDTLDLAALLPEDRWILARLSQTIRRYHHLIEKYQFSASVKLLREFFWDSLCDWYLELTKPRITPEPQASTCASVPVTDTSRNSAKQVLAFCMDQTLRLWHPTMPFITERLWKQLNVIVPKRGLPDLVDLPAEPHLITASFPPQQGYPSLEDEEILNVFAGIQAVVHAVRDLRARCHVSPKEAVKATVALPESQRDAFETLAHIVVRMAHVIDLTIDPHAKRPVNAGSVTTGSIRVFVHDISDDEAERAATGKALTAIEKQIIAKESKLANDKFITRAKPDIVQAERKRLAELRDEQCTLRAHLAELNG